MDVPGSIQVVLHLDQTAPSIHGWVEDVTGRPVEFYGWIKLSTLLNALCTQHEDERIAQVGTPASLAPSARPHASPPATAQESR